MNREESIQRYDAWIDKCDRFERKGKNMIYTSANGHMFSIINKEGELGIRFSKEVQQKYFEEFDTTFFKSYGAKMQGYVLIPEKLWDNETLIINLLNESYEFVMSLDPK